MTWGNPPKFISDSPKQGKKIQPEDIAGDSESSQQKALFAWAALSVGKYPQLAFMFAIPNGGLRDVRTATTLKAEGVKSGVPDIFLPWPNIRYAGLWIELKTKIGRLSKNQESWIEYLKTSSYSVCVCRSWEEAKDKILEYLNAT